jgi:hypothetical protein
MLSAMLSKLLPGFQFESKLDVGHFLTFITLLAGFVSWAVTSFIAWRRRSYQDAGSGALRLILRILRESKEQSLPLGEVKRRFDAAEMKEKRNAYCGRNYHFKNETHFEAAIYHLESEGKVVFLSSDEITFRVDKYLAEQLQRTAEKELAAQLAFQPSQPDVDSVLRVLEKAIQDPKVNDWDLRPLAQSAQKVSADRTHELLRKALADPDSVVQRKVATVLGDLLPPAGAKAPQTVKY